ncbi:hypothetical protein [Myxococcus sp. SDU36]|uniref:hypothetical protein n=1 Tax=Myxococcus sp. SDU36 TaxID=2831967 RepID=UPI002543634D|nr:hypothetical protein [Myxococcus sp. SDU36]WIG92969.1 hypothetical protein KGD87_20310 [Myxococcus sp. SDU36]
MLAVTGIGMVSALGHGVVEGCAASRAGLVRIAPLEEPRLFDPGNGTEPAKGHCIPWVTAGFTGLGRLTALAVAGFEDLALSADTSDLSRSALYLVVPSDFHRRRVEEQGLLAEDHEARREVYLKRLLPAVLKHLKPRAPPPLQRLYFGEAGLIDALKDATACLRANQVDRCIIGAVDSLVDPQVTWALDQLGLLKGPERPTGVLPGEAAAFAVLELPISAARRQAGIEAHLEGPRAESEPFHRRSRQPATGQALSRCIRATLEALPDKGKDTRLVIAGLNGDAYRAQDWGTALVRLSDLSLGDARQWYPAQSFGEIGAATGLVGLCMVVRAFARGYARTSGALVWTAGDDGSRSAFYVRAPGGSLFMEARE